MKTKLSAMTCLNDVIGLQKRTQMAGRYEKNEAQYYIHNEHTISADNYIKQMSTIGHGRTNRKLKNYKERQY